MIFEAIFNLIKSLILFIISLFPTIPDMSFLSQSLEPLVNALVSINSLISISLFAWCCFTLIIILNIEFVWSIIIWVVRKIPGVS